MKKTISVFLSLLMLVSSLAVFTTGASAAAGDNVLLKATVPIDLMFGCDPLSADYAAALSNDGVVFDMKANPNNQGAVFKLWDVAARYDINGTMNGSAEYSCVITYELAAQTKVDAFKFYSFAYDSNVLLQLNTFDIFASETGKDGSFVRVYSANELRDKKSYTEIAATGRSYSFFADKFTSTVNAKYIRIAVVDGRGDSYANLVNIPELEVYEAGGTIKQDVAETVKPFPGDGKNNVLKSAALVTDGMIGCTTYNDTYSVAFANDGDILTANQGSVFKMLDPTWAVKYTVDGKEAADGKYIAALTYELAQTEKLNGFNFFAYSSTGSNATARVESFDVYVSADGTAGSWKLVSEAHGLLTGGKYIDGESVGCFYSYYGSDFPETSAKFVRFAIIEGRNAYKNVFNVGEIEVYAAGAAATTTKAAAATTVAATTATTAAVTTKTAAATATTTKAAATTAKATTKAPTTAPTTSDAAPIAMIALAAAVCAAAIVFSKKKRV